MNTILNKSSLLAAIEISKDPNILKSNNLNYLESVKTSFDIKGGQKLIELVGLEIINELNAKLKEYDYQIILRQILIKYLKDEKPGFLLRVTGGRDYFLNYIDENFEQLLNDAGLYNEINLSKEGKEIRHWWDDLSDFVRDLDEDKKIDLGREGEEKTILYEINKLKKLNIKKEPKWISYEDNRAGYDVLSWDKEQNEIFIEVKATSNSNGLFYLSKGEWRLSIAKKDHYFIHIWIQDRKEPRIITYDELNSKNYKIEDSSNAEWEKIKITPVLIN